MNKISSILNSHYINLLSENTKKKSEKIIVYIAIIVFLIHLLMIALNNLNLLPINYKSNFLSNPIAAIYTPFTFILFYEVYLLVYYLPKSTTIYIGKQYEIITLIIIRRLFKDLSKLEFTPDWFTIKHDIQFNYDLIGTIILFYLIYLFNKFNKKNLEYQTKSNIATSPDLAAFKKVKRRIANLLIPILIILAIYSFGHWIQESFFSIRKIVGTIGDINKVFFDDFFTILILVDVLLLLLSFLHTDTFQKVIRNSSFIISTILIKLSFGTEGLLNTILIVVAVIFGVIIMGIHNKHDEIDL